MNREQTDKIISEIDDKYIDEAACITQAGRTDADEKVRRRSVRIRWGIIAACLLIAALIASTAVACAKEAKEYREAIDFFNLNGLSAEGLTRTEVKEVYRDISTKNYTNSKTSDVIMKAVPGLELQEKDLSPEEIEAINWDNLRMKVYPGGISFRLYSPPSGLINGLECYKDRALLWRTDFEEYFILNYWYSEDGTAVYLHKCEKKDGTIVFSDDYNIALIDNTGKVIWNTKLEHTYVASNVAGILSNDDSTWTAIGYGVVREPWHKYLFFERYDANGNRISTHQTEFDDKGVVIQCAARMGNGFIISTGEQSLTPSASSTLLYVDRKGNVLEEISYETDDCYYVITDMVAFHGRLYLAGNEFSKQYLDRSDLMEQYKQSSSGIALSSDEVTRFVWEHFTAVLLVCDPENWQLDIFCSVCGSEAGLLSSIDPDRLGWTVERISSAYYSPYTSSHTFEGTSRVIQYEFDPRGRLIDRKETEDIVYFSR